MYVRMYNNYRLLVSDSLKKRYASKCANKIEGESSMNVLNESQSLMLYEDFVRTETRFMPRRFEPRDTIFS